MRGFGGGVSTQVLHEVLMVHPSSRQRIQLVSTSDQSLFLNFSLEPEVQAGLFALSPMESRKRLCPGHGLCWDV